MVVLTLVTAHAASTDLKPYRGNPQAPPLALPALDGTVRTLEAYRGKVVLLNFWASWCEPCLTEMPSLERLEAGFSDQAFAVVTVNIGEDPQTVSAWLERLNVRLTVLLDGNGAVTRAWRVFAFPSTFLIDPTGQITHANFGALEWDQGAAFELIESLVNGG
jgi:thiol-disulfide isomerase/thioredoxin